MVGLSVVVKILILFFTNTKISEVRSFSVCCISCSFRFMYQQRTRYLGHLVSLNMNLNVYILSRFLTVAISFYQPFYPFPDSRRLSPKRILETFYDIVEKFNSSSYMRWAVGSIIHSFQNAKISKYFVFSLLSFLVSVINLRFTRRPG